MKVGGAGSSGMFFSYRQPENTLAHLVCEASPRQEESAARPYYEPVVHKSMSEIIHHSLRAPGLVTPTFVPVCVEVGHTEDEVLYPGDRNPCRSFWHHAGSAAHRGSR